MHHECEKTGKKIPKVKSFSFFTRGISDKSNRLLPGVIKIPCLRKSHTKNRFLSGHNNKIQEKFLSCALCEYANTLFNVGNIKNGWVGRNEKGRKCQLIHGPPLA